ncbi:hypothetical protein L3Q82_008367 [Scortum barcoo]|uniref:Uncharacterized protein n=1 Tax=Scortum barcoo TaxID=214431 RepID=A0ACB8WHQ4_9TELE|nr:hypothetical protein L3Q82_008367 [Scortum barcoo]
MLHRTYTHLDTPDASVRFIFFDFTSAFNTIRPGLLGEKMRRMEVDAFPGPVVRGLSLPQTAVSVVGLIRGDEEEEYRKTIEEFVNWSEHNHLILNTAKTKEVIVDFRKRRRRRDQPTPISIRGTEVEVVSSHRYLGVQLDEKLDWRSHTESVYRKGQSRLYFLRRLRSFNICPPLLQSVYHTVVASALFFAVVCWGEGLRTADKNRLNKLIKKAGSVVGTELPLLQQVTEGRMLSKLQAILTNASHPLHALEHKYKNFHTKPKTPQISCKLCIE